MKRGSWKSVFALPLLLSAGAWCADLPQAVFETDFQVDAKGGVIDNVSPASPGRIIGGKVAILDTEIGRAAKFEAKPGIRIEFPDTEKIRTPETFTFSAWFRIDDYPDGAGERSRRCYGFLCRGWRFYGIISHEGKIQGNALQRYPLNGPVKQAVPGEWMHFAYTYSVGEKRYELFINGRKVAAKSANWKKESPVPVDFKEGLYFGSVKGFWPFKGMVGRTRLYAEALSGEQIAASEQDLVRKQLLGLKKELAGVENSDALADRIENLLRLAVIPIHELERCRREWKSICDMSSLRHSGKAANEFYAYSIVDPMGAETFTLDTPLPSEGLNGKLLILAARNEYEPASFLLRPLKDIPRFLPVAEDLRSKEGNTLPASALDIRLVKVMVACGSYNRGPGALRTLQPLALLYDDALVRVDPEAMHNYIRLSFPDGEKYICISDEKGGPNGRQLSARKYPIRDAKTLQALDLKSGVNQQFWITLKTEKDTKPGLYESRIRLTSGGKTIGAIPLKVRVLPFELPEPKTNYDLSRPFQVSTYYFNTMVDKGDGTVGCGRRTVAQTRADLQNMYAHGVRLPTTIMAFSFPAVYPPWNKKYPHGTPKPDPTEEELELNRKRFRLLKEVGMWTKPLLLHTGGNFGYREFYDRKRDFANLKEIVAKTLDFCRKELGHRDVIFYAVDEAEGDRIKAQYPVWEDMTKLGAKIFVTAKPENLHLLAGRGISVINFCHKPDRKTAEAVHKDNALVWKYANPFPTPGRNDKAAVHRLNYGLQLYFTDHDGVCSYSFNHYGAQLGWNTFGHGTGCIYVFPTADGVVDTPAWEGHREGTDDIRYATRLRLEIVRAAKGDARRRALAEEAAAFLDSLNPHSAEFDPRNVRWRIIDKTLDLMNQ